MIITSVGWLEEVSVPLPSSPAELSPHAQTVPSFRMERVCESPAETWAANVYCAVTKLLVMVALWIACTFKTAF
ncbi:MAG: hypothetical protein WDO13_18205 [Verrucomicrobiota bacterium]